MIPVMYEETLAIPNLTIKLHLPLCELSSQAFKFRPLFDPKKFYTVQELDGIWLNAANFEHFENIYNLSLTAIRAELIDDFSTRLTKPNMEVGVHNEEMTAILFGEAEPKQWKQLRDEVFEELKQLIHGTHIQTYSAVELQQVMSNLFLEPFNFGERDELFLKLMLLHGIKHGHLEFSYIQLNSTQMSDIVETLGWSMRQLLASTVTSLRQLFHVYTSTRAQIWLTDVSVSALGHMTLELEINLADKVEDLEIRVHSFMYEWINYILFDAASQLLEVVGNDRAYLVTKLNVLRFNELHYWLTSATYVQLMAHDSTQPFLAYMNALSEEVEIPVTTNWQLISKTSLCVEEDNYTVCVAHCLLREHIILCNCIPWHMQQLGTTQRLCSSPCFAVNEPNCHSECSFKLCQLKSIGFGPNEITQTRNYGNMLQFRLYAKQHLHMKLIEEYDFTLGTLIGELGGLSDFWLGVNLFAILHAIVHAIKLCVKHRKKMASRGRQKTKLKIWKKKRAEAAEVLRQIETSIVALKHAAAAQKLITYKRKGRFDWLRHNKFFADTPMSIFPFIDMARSIAEVLFWYLVIVGCCVHTSINFYTAVDYYRSKPTKIEAHLSHDQIVPMGNLSFTFDVPLLELSNFDPTQSHLRDMSQSRVTKMPASMIDFMVCGLTDSVDPYIHFGLEELTREWLRSYNWKLLPPSSGLNNDLSSNQTMQHWHSIFKVASQNLAMFMANNHHVKISHTSKEKLDKLREEFLELLAAPMLRFSSAYVPFFILNGFKFGQHPQERIIEKVKEDPLVVGEYRFANADGVDLFENTTHIGDILDGRTPLQVYKLAQHYLSMMLHVNIKGIENAKVYLQDWNLDPATDHINWLRYQNIALAVVFPGDNRATRVDFEIRSYSQVWHGYILDTLFKHYHSRNRANESVCMGLEDFARVLHIEYGTYTWDWWWPTDGFGLTAHPDDRNDIQFMPFDPQTREFHSIKTLTSMTDK